MTCKVRFVFPVSNLLAPLEGSPTTAAADMPRSPVFLTRSSLELRGFFYELQSSFEKIQESTREIVPDRMGLHVQPSSMKFFVKTPRKSRHFLEDNSRCHWHEL